MTDVAFSGLCLRKQRVIRLIDKTVTTVFNMHDIEAYNVSVFITSDKRIKEINNRQRGIDKPTDVLSFPAADDFKGDADGFYGDIVVSKHTAKRQAKTYQQSFERELMFLIIHGCLHLLGYDHENDDQEKKMRDAQRTALKELGAQSN